MVIDVLNEVVLKCVEKVYKMREEFFITKDQFDLDGYYNSAHKSFEKTFLEVIALSINELDENYNKTRDKKKVAITHRNKNKPILMKEGRIKLKRNRYVDRKTKVPFYFLDNLLGLDERQRISRTFQSQILKFSSERSYKRVEKEYGGKVSCTTAMNIAKRNKGALESILSDKYLLTGKRVVKRLFIEADEDHVHLRDGTNTVVKLAYIHEGYKTNNTLCQKRELINAHYISLVKGDIWTRIKKYINSTYAPGTPISIHGDGASWIKAGLKQLPLATFHLDKFHTYQAITRVSAGKKEKANKIIESIKNRDSEYINSLYWKRFKRNANVDTSSGKMHGLIYLLNNLEYTNLHDENICCSAEGHVSHILSARMSSRPMA